MIAGWGTGLVLVIVALGVFSMVNAVTGAVRERAATLFGPPPLPIAFRPAPWVRRVQLAGFIGALAAVGVSVGAMEPGRPQTVALVVAAGVGLLSGAGWLLDRRRRLVITEAEVIYESPFGGFRIDRRRIREVVGGGGRWVIDAGEGRKRVVPMMFERGRLLFSLLQTPPGGPTRP